MIDLLREHLAALLAFAGVFATAFFAFWGKRKTDTEKKIDEYDWVVNQTKNLYEGVAQELTKAKEDIRHAEERLDHANARILKLEELLKKSNQIVHEKDEAIAHKDEEILELRRKIAELEGNAQK